MADRVRERGLVGWRRAVQVFFKTQLSAYVASLADFLVAVSLVKFSSLPLLYATFSGSLAGGMVNCVINYGWVFHADDCKKWHVALKYFLVWSGSILLNTWGTVSLNTWLSGMRWVNTLPCCGGDNVFILSKVVVAVLVAVFWNFQLQRVFVYRNHHFKGFMRQHLENKKD